MPQTPLQLCLISPPQPVADAMEAQGHAVLILRPPHGTLAHLPSLLAEHAFTPDLIIQTEVLAERILLSGLEELHCPKAFWAVDPHLNAYWHAPYGRLFDLVFSTQKRWVGELARMGAEVRWLPWYGLDKAWTGWTRRDLPMSFVGRVTSGRPTRKRFVELLRSRFPNAFTHAQDLNPQEMFQLYERTRLIPNESIMGEINFRLFEGAAHGCLVIGQDLEGQDELFEPDREMAVYHDSLDLVRQCSRLLADPASMAMARAGYERVQAEHLPGHRARTMLDALQAAGRAAAQGDEGRKWLALARAELWRAGRLAQGGRKLLEQLAPFASDPDVLTSLCRLLAELDRSESLRDLLDQVLASRQFADNAGVNAACGLSALAAGMADLEARFRQRQGGETEPMGERESYLFWADVLHRAGLAQRSGFVINEVVHVPGSALECLAKGLTTHPGDLEYMRRMDALLADFPGAEPTRVGLLSHLSLHEPDDWCHSLNAGLAHLKSFRVEAGLEELALARSLADNAGQGDVFLADLADLDLSGQLSVLLESA